MTDIDDRIRSAVGDILDAAPNIGDRPGVESETKPAEPRPLLVGAAIATVAIGIGAIVLIDRRGEDMVPGADRSGAPTVAVSTMTLPLEIGDGRLILDPVPDGMILVNARSGTSVGSLSGQPITRVYATDHLAPETSAAIAVTTGWPFDVPDGAEPVDINGVEGHVERVSPVAERLVFTGAQGLNVAVEGYHLSRQELVTAAAAVEISSCETAELGVCGAIATQALPPSVTELAVGTGGFRIFQPLTAEQGTMTGASWRNSTDDQAISYESHPVSAINIPANRLGYETFTDTEINGRPAFVRRSDAGVVSILIWDDRRAIFLRGSGLTAEELIAAASTLRPASDEEWQAMTNATSQPSPGSQVTTTRT